MLRHELVHVITLQQTHFNIPHWYTEGLAVRAEDTPRPSGGTSCFAAACPRESCSTLDTINFGFTRPKSSDDWQMAYCQAELYVDYMLEHHPPEALGSCWPLTPTGWRTRQAIPRVLGMSQEEFERGYVDYLKQLSHGTPARRSSAREVVRRIAEAAPRQARGRRRRGRVGLCLPRPRGGRGEPRLAEEVAKLQPKHPLAGYVLARLHSGGRDGSGGRAAGGLPGRRAPQPDVVALLAGLRVRAEEYDEAARLYSLAKRHDPENSGGRSRLPGSISWRGTRRN